METQSHCGLGVCAAMDGHPGTCEEASGWDSEDVPHRIQQRRTKGWRKPQNTVTVARPSRYGNPFRVGHTFQIIDATRVIVSYADRRDVYVRDARTAVDLYREWMEGRIWIVGFHKRPTEADLRLIRGKNLMCFCASSQPCHADVLLEIANG